MNKKQITITLVSATLAISMLAAQGCDLRQLVKVDVPQEILNATGTTHSVTLQNVDIVLYDWYNLVERTTTRLEASVDQAEQKYQLLHQIVSIGMEAGSSASQSVPWGGLIFGALTGAAALFVPPPLVRKKTQAPEITERGGDSER